MNSEERRQLRVFSTISVAGLMVIGAMILATSTWQVILLGVALLALAWTASHRAPDLVRSFMGRHDDA